MEIFTMPNILRTSVVCCQHKRQDTFYQRGSQMSGKRSRDNLAIFGNQKHKQDERLEQDRRILGRIGFGKRDYAPHRHAKRLKEKGISREEAVLVDEKWRMEHRTPQESDSYA